MFRKVDTNVYSVPPSIDSFYIMHVQMGFKSSNEMENALKHELNFTSQRFTAGDPQSSQPSEEDDSTCKWYKGKKYVSPRWKFKGSKIHEDVKSLVPEWEVGEYINAIGGYYVHPNTGLVMAGKVIDYLLSVAEMQALLPEKKNPANIRARHDLCWFSVSTEFNSVEFEFLVLARGMS